MSGRSAYYMEMIANAELVGIHTAASAPTVAPPGGTRPALGTNPIAFGMPSSLGPVLPEGVAVDRQGRPKRDPTQARLGALLPFGGYKGYGLAFIVQALGLLAGPALDAGEDDGYLLVAFKPVLLVSRDQFKKQLGQLVDRIKDTPRQPGVGEIRIPGERAFRSREHALTDGIEIDRAIYDALGALQVIG